MKRPLFSFLLFLSLSACSENPTLQESPPSSTPSSRFEEPSDPLASTPSPFPTLLPSPVSSPSIPAPTSLPSPDSTSLCGNGQIDSGEFCDGEKIGTLFDKPLDCTFALTVQNKTFTPSEGTLRCRADCTFDVADCQPLCGNGKLDGDEECDLGNPSLAPSRCSNDCKASCASDEVLGIFEGNGKGALDGRGHCYLDLPQVRRTFSEADRLCKIFGGHLVVFDSPQEYDFVTTRVLQKEVDQSRWIGMRRGESDDPNERENYEDWFYWSPFRWGIEQIQFVPPQAAWKGKKGRAPDALVPGSEFLQFLWQNNEPSFCRNFFCFEVEQAVEILGKKQGFRLNDTKEDEEKGFICEIEPPTLKGE